MRILLDLGGVGPADLEIIKHNNKQAWLKYHNGKVITLNIEEFKELKDFLKKGESLLTMND